MKKLSVLALGTALALSAPVAIQASGLNTGVDLGVGVGDDTGVNAGADANITVAQDVGVDAGAGVDAEAGGDDSDMGADVEADATGSVSYSYDDAVAAIEGASGTLPALESATSFDIVAISELSAGETADMTAVTEAHTAAEATLGELHEAVAANAELMAALEAEGYTDTDVVGISTAAGGAVTVFVDG